MRAYIAGPMSGLPHFNYPAFHAAAARLRGLGYDVVSPAELHPDPYGQPRPHTAYMRGDIAALLTAQAIVLLPGWEGSQGACLEEAVARACGLQVLLLPQMHTKAAEASVRALGDGA